MRPQSRQGFSAIWVVVGADELGHVIADRALSVGRRCASILDADWFAHRYLHMHEAPNREARSFGCLGVVQLAAAMACLIATAAVSPWLFGIFG